MCYGQILNQAFNFWCFGRLQREVLVFYDAVINLIFDSMQRMPWNNGIFANSIWNYLDCKKLAVSMEKSGFCLIADDSSIVNDLS